MDRFDLANETRQSLLDLANKVGRISSREAFETLGYTMDSVYRSLLRMTENGELQKHGKNTQIYFTPLKTTTMPAEQMRANQYKTRIQNKSALERKEKSKLKKKEPWRTVHLGSEREHPIKNQGGQGNLRRNVYIQSCMD